MRREIARRYRRTYLAGYSADSARRFSGHTRPGAERFVRRLLSAPFAELEDFGFNSDAFATLVESGASEQQVVPVSRVLGCKPEGVGWYLTDRSPADNPSSYLYSLAEAIRAGTFNPDKDRWDICLFQLGAAYFVTTNGRHRLAAMKGLVGPPITVSARVEPATDPLRVTFFNRTSFDSLTVALSEPEGVLSLPGLRAEYAEVEKRRRDGLWQGRVVKASVDSGWSGSSTSLPDALRSITVEVDSCVGPWVFAERMSEVRESYERMLAQ